MVCPVLGPALTDVMRLWTPEFWGAKMVMPASMLPEGSTPSPSISSSTLLRLLLSADSSAGVPA